MFTKFYEKIKKFIKENYKGILLILIIYILFNYSLPYSIYTPGGVINMSDRIESEDKLYETSGSINSTYVSMVKGTIPMLLLSKIMPSWDIISNDELTMDNENIAETMKRDQYYMQEAISNATLVAYKKAGKEVDVVNQKNIITYISDEAKTDLKLYDNILSYDGISFESFNNLREYIAQKLVGDVINFEVIRDDKKIMRKAEVIDLNGEKKIGLMIATINEYKTSPQITVKTLSSESGPSGGLMTALAIYEAITEDDITKNRIIAGTGTIDSDGNVGEIGAITYKIAGAVKKGADVFLAPRENYEEAKEFTEKKGYDIIIVSVGTFDDAIDYLESEVD